MSEAKPYLVIHVTLSLHDVLRMQPSVTPSPMYYRLLQDKGLVFDALEPLRYPGRIERWEDPATRQIHYQQTILREVRVDD